jgi:hypothetical protein
MTLQDTVFQFQERSRIFENHNYYILESKWNVAIVLCVYKKFICDSVCGKLSQQNTLRRNSCF